MVTPEEFQVRHEQSSARAEELRGKIVRAQSWDQLFATPKEAEADFKTNLIDSLIY